MTTFDLLMIPVWLWIAGCFGLWLSIMADCIRQVRQEARDRRDPELMSTQVLPYGRETAGLDTQLLVFRRVHKPNDYRCLQDLIATKTFAPKGN
jgi:hypothetical protein